MSSLTTTSPARFAAVALLMLITAAGCNQPAENPGVIADGPGEPTPTATGVPPTDEPEQEPAPASTTKAPAAPSWPTPEDCISYNPNNVTVHYEAGVHAVKDGSKIIMRVGGGPGDVIGQKALALAKRYKSHCYLGRGNNREERNQYEFDYWRNSSGMTPAIPDSEDDCSPYNKNNLTVEDMGGGYGWRVKDHDHVLQLFDNESDARNGKLVLAKYSQICSIGDPDDGFDVVTYFP